MSQRPVDAAYFDLAAEQGDGVLVVCETPASRQEAADLLAADGVTAHQAAGVTPEGLRDALVVVLLAPPGEPLHPDAMAVLAARRVLVTSPAEPSFGLQPDIDHLVADGVWALVPLVGGVLKHPHAYELMRAFGALHAERHRAENKR